jgi:SAM-dependent methyltransferase
LTEPSRTKPRHLDLEYAAQFGDEEVAAAYRHRPPYPPETFAILESLLGSRPRAVLELGAGTGDLTIGLMPLIDRLIAVEPSRPMLDRGRRRTAAAQDRVEWLAVAAEDYAFDGCYAAVVAAEAFHWLDWRRVLARVAAGLIASGHLILGGRKVAAMPWDEDLRRLIRDYSTNQDYVAYDLVTELESRGLLAIAGRTETQTIAHRQTIEDYVESFHSRNGFSRARLTAARAQEFDDQLEMLVRRYDAGDIVQLPVRARITWGRPVADANWDG